MQADGNFSILVISRATDQIASLIVFQRVDNWASGVELSVQSAVIVF